MSVALEPYHLTVDEFVAFCATDPDRYQRFELAEGNIWGPMPESIEHSDLVEHVASTLRERYRPERVRTTGSVQLDGDGLVLPDVYVLAAEAVPAGEYWRGDQLDLAIEVSLSTWQRDAGPKLRSYARSGVPAYIIVGRHDDGEPVLFLHTQPDGDLYASTETTSLDRLTDWERHPRLSAVARAHLQSSDAPKRRRAYRDGPDGQPTPGG